MEVRLAERGLQVEVVSRGSGPPVLWIPGSGADHLGFGPPVRRLTNGFTHWLYDPRGTGRTRGPIEPLTVDTLASDCAALVEALGLDRVAFVAHSLGTRVAIETARRLGDRVVGMVLWAPWRAADRFFGRQMDLIRWMVSTLPQEKAAEFLLWRLASSALQNEEPKRFEQILEGMFLGTGSTPWDRVVRYLSVGPTLSDLPAPLHGFAPTLVLAAEGDRMVPPQYARDLFDALPPNEGHAFHLLTGERASHLAHVEMPDAFAQVVSQHLAGLKSLQWQ